jgi:hypothetical protein
MFRWRSLGVALVTALVIAVIPLAVNAPASGAYSKRKCSRLNDTPFVPIAISSPGLGRIVVKGLKPHPNGIPRTLPLNEAGKTQVAWDKPSFRPGSPTGHVLMNAHVWPDGSSVGSHLNDTFKRGKLVKVLGAKGQVQCYQLTKRIVKRPSRKLAKQYYGDINSKHRLAILTCSGVRRGPGDWSLRSVWLAKPVS